ncbi:MAG: type II toxin-antitoxin system MqsA family antitoxin [Clostridiales bacterium]|nr:type II toxin-antitoxin system MqsA family antitoxin [Clostridiales bacterium]
MRCLLCNAGPMVESRSTYFAQLPQCYVIIENVPSRKCPQCGEIVYSASVMERIDEILVGVRKIAAKVLIMDYEPAA